MKPLALAVSAFALFAVGCSGSIDQKDFCQEYSKALCETSVKCCTSQSLDEASCETGWKSFCDRGILPAIEAKKTEYDPSAAADCVNDVRDQQNECKAPSDDEVTASCKKALKGTIPEGGDCTEFILSCAEGLTCRLHISNDTTTGTCVKPVAEGGDCSNASCDDGLFCASDDTCKKAAAIGEACSGAVQCVRGAYCTQDSNTCAAQKDEGASCGSAFECKSFSCTNGTCTAESGGFCFVPTQG